LFFTTLSVFTFPLISYGTQPVIYNTSDITSAFRNYVDISSVSISVPTVVEVPITNEFLERYDFAVLDTTSNIFEPYFFKKITLANEAKISVETSPQISNAYVLTDNNNSTYGEFILPNNSEGHVEISLTSQEPITSSMLVTLLDANVAFPTSVEIRALLGESNRIVLAKSRVDGSTIRFPKTTSRSWTISFTYAQPLRISELHLIQENTSRINTQAVRFLAQPNHSYRIYLNPDRYVQTPVGEAGNLAQAKDVITLKATSSILNNKYVISDQDGDGIADVRDNCVSVANPLQVDVNTNGRGDDCDDFDEDNVINTKDNCPDNPNYDQKDTDNDGIGDVCDVQESRFTEQYPWIPWVGIGFAALVLVVLFALTARAPHEPTQTPL